MKEKATNGIDYTPRESKRAGIAARNALKNQQRHIHSKLVDRQQMYPIFEVIAGGKVIEWTDIRKDAHEAYKDASVLPKHLVLVQENGMRRFLDAVSRTGRRAQ